MKKNISILCTLAILITLVALPVSAVNYETETVTSLGDYYLIDSSNNNVENGITIVDDAENGAEHPVIKVDFVNTQRDFGIAFPNLTESGTYRLTAKYRCTANPGQGRLGIRRGTPQGGNNNNYADNSPTGTIKQSDAYRTDSVDFTVDTNKQDNNGQFARIRFGNGTAGECYVAEFKLQKVNTDESGNETLGENVLPIFYTERVKGITDGWQLTNSNDTMEIDYADIDGVNKPVIKWSYNQTGGSHLRYYLGGHNVEEKNLPEGNYRISVTYYAPKNPGTGRIGIRNDSNGAFPGNNSTKSIVQNSEYQTVTRDLTVGEASSYAKQYLDIACESGESSDIYIAEVKLQKVNSDESLGENLIENGDFMVVKSYDVTLVTNGGEVAVGKAVTSYTPGEETQLPQDITRSGYRFGGWYETVDYSGDVVTLIPTSAKGDKTYYAKWVSEFSDVATAKITEKTSEAQHSSWAIAVTAKKDIKQSITLKIGDKTIMEYPADKSGIAANKTINFGVLVRREITAADITVEADGEQIAVE